MHFRSILTFFFICLTIHISAQDSVSSFLTLSDPASSGQVKPEPALSDQVPSNEEADDHEHHKHEVGIGNSLVYFIKGREFAYALHFHYTRNIPGTAFEAGLGFERIFSETAHNVMLLEWAYRPVEELSIGVSPGLLMEEDHPGVRFAFHVEIAYEIEIRGFHVGPVLELAFDNEDVHLSLGLHAGIAF